MFLTNKELNLENFLNAVGFVPPKGFNLAYIITPKSADTTELESSGFVQQQQPDDSNNVKYLKRDPKLSQSFSAPMKPLMMPNEMPKNPPIPVNDKLGEPADVMTPKRGVIVVESNDRRVSIMLKESKGPFIKNTLLCFQKE